MRTVTPRPPSSSGVDRVDRVVVGDPAGAAGQPQPHRRGVGLGLVDAVVDVALVGLRRRGGRLVEDDDVVDPVEAEQPDALGAAAPGLQVPLAVDQEQPHRVDGPLGALVAGGHVVVQVQRPLALQPVPDDGERLLAGVDADRDGRDPVGGVPGGGGDLGQRAADRLALGEAGQLEQGAQRDDQRDRLVGGQPQRPPHAGGEGDPDAVALEGEVDQVAGAVAGQAAHPQQLEVAAQLPLGDAEVAGRLGRRATPSGRAVRYGTSASSRVIRSGVLVGVMRSPPSRPAG